ncbi:hypothetical protein D3C74_331480 [compost metagenome]
MEDDKIYPCANSFMIILEVTAILPFLTSSKSRYFVKSESTNINTQSRTAPTSVHTVIPIKILKSILVPPIYHISSKQKRRRDLLRVPLRLVMNPSCRCIIACLRIASSVLRAHLPLLCPFRASQIHRQDLQILNSTHCLLRLALPFAAFCLPCVSDR